MKAVEERILSNSHRPDVRLMTTFICHNLSSFLLYHYDLG
jgi:hypothetical protein